MESSSTDIIPSFLDSVSTMEQENFTGCYHSNNTSFKPIQVIFRVYIMPCTYFFGICANIMNIYVFSHKQMRSQLVNWFLLVLALSDLCVLVSSFFVFSLPVVAEYMEDYELVSLSPKLLVMFYPVAHSSHTTSVYLTILVSVHRYLGVCHPFLIRRISSRSVVRTIILVAIVFAFLFDLPRWFELENVPCLSEIFNRPSEMVLPTYFYGNYIYSIVYRNAAYTIVMFMVPFVILTWVNYRIISTLKASKKLRRTMTQIQGHADSEKACFVQHSTNNNNHIASTIHNSNEHRSSIVSLTKMAKITRKFSGPYMKSGDANERKENGITIMLVAMVTGFLMFNLLAFINNILEFFEDYKQSELYTMLVETGTLLVNLNGAITIVIYMVFGSKYRAIFLNLLTRILHKTLTPKSICRPTETTALIPTSQTNLITKRQKLLKMQQCRQQQSFLGVSVDSPPMSYGRSF